LTNEKRGGLSVVSSDIWSGGEESIAMFEFAPWHASSPDFFLRCSTAIGKQFLIENDKNSVR
jgi:hypothetical protein